MGKASASPKSARQSAALRRVRQRLLLQLDLRLDPARGARQPAVQNDQNAWDFWRNNLPELPEVEDEDEQARVDAAMSPGADGRLPRGAALAAVQRWLDSCDGALATLVAGREFVHCQSNSLAMRSMGLWARG